MNLTPPPARPTLRSPQPNQTFFHVPPDGNSYTSDASCLITPLTPADAVALRALGCVDEVEGVGVTVAEEVLPKVKAKELIDDKGDR